jgi:hypothetical protein
MKHQGGIGRGTRDSSAPWSGVYRMLARARRFQRSYLGPDWCVARSYISEALCGIGDPKLCVHKFSAKLAPNTQKCFGKQQLCREKDAQTLKIHQDSSPLGNKAGMTKRLRQ